MKLCGLLGKMQCIAINLKTAYIYACILHMHAPHDIVHHFVDILIYSLPATWVLLQQGAFESIHAKLMPSTSMNPKERARMCTVLLLLGFDNMHINAKVCAM